MSARFYIVLALLVVAWVAVNEPAIDDEIASQREARERRQQSEQFVREVCEVRGFKAVTDNTGRVVCPDSGPSWANFSHPMIYREVRE